MSVKKKLFGYSEFFLQDKDELDAMKLKMIQSLNNLNRSQRDIERYCIAYDYFVENPLDYNGSTFVRDLFIIRSNKRDSKKIFYKLSVDSMYHDFEWVVLKANRNLLKNFKSNLRYFNNLRRNGKGIHLFRFLGLNILAFFVVPYNNIRL